MKSGTSSNGSVPLDIGSGLHVGLTNSGVWHVCAKNGCFELREAADFWRVVILLERPYSEVDSMFKEYAAKLGTENYFPLWKVISAGLDFKVDEWASLALKWFPSLAKDQKVVLGSLLEEVARSRWAGQKSRQLAGRYANQLRN